MATSYPGSTSSSEKRHRAEVTVKSEPGEDNINNMMAGPRDFPVDMSVAPRDSHHELSSVSSASHRYGGMPLAPVVGHDRSYFSALYANNILAHSPGALTQQQYFPSQRHFPHPEAQRQLSSPPSPQQHQQQQQQQQQQQHQQHHQQQQQQRQPRKLSQHQLQAAAREVAPVESNHQPTEDNVTNFKFKDSSGKLAMLDMLGSESDSMDMLSSHQRAKREFVPDNRKDESYWNKRLKNNDSARRSRVKRKALEKLMESRLHDLQKENIELRHEMLALKRRFGVPDEPSTVMPAPSVSSNSAQDLAGELESYARDEELEQQSAGSDDSHSHDDSRVYNISSMSALSHALGPTARERTDSFGSGTSSCGRSSRPESRSSQYYHPEYPVRTDKMGALDLTSDHSNRSTPAREQSLTPEACGPPSSTTTSSQKSKNLSQTSVSSLMGDMEMDDKKAAQEMRAFPLKCRWKREMQSANHTSPPAPSNTE